MKDNIKMVKDLTVNDLKKICLKHSFCLTCPLMYNSKCLLKSTETDTPRDYKILYDAIKNNKVNITTGNLITPPKIVVPNVARESVGLSTLENDSVNKPAHYTDGKIEVIDFIEDKKLGFCLGNAVKYIARAGKKYPAKEVEDLQKAEWYIKRRIKELTEVSGK